MNPSAAAANRAVRLVTGETVAALGQGTWRMGALQAHREEALALRLGFDLGLTLIDTAEIYGDGQAEQLIGEILSDRRDEIFIVSKVAPQNAGPGRLREHCEASLRRLNTDRIDLYLLHWRDHRPLAEIVEGMEALKAAGKIRHWGVSNFDVADMEALMAAGGEGCAANQIAYNLATRGAEFLAGGARDRADGLQPHAQGEAVERQCLAGDRPEHGRIAGRRRLELGPTAQGRDRHSQGGEQRAHAGKPPGARLPTRRRRSAPFGRRLSAAHR
jgi:aryl-alcohol dehydrogenase-like predicted oxidoreductase